MDALDGTERVETAIIGGGQAGLATAYYLKERGRPFVILDAGDRVGDAWRTRWESLRLFTPARFDSLPGFPFPGSNWSFPTKDEMADYLEAYVERFDLPVRTGVKVERLEKEGDRFVITSSRGRVEAANVVVATGSCQNPKVPGFADQLRPDITQLHSKDYLSPSQLAPGDVLVVGVGNSGAEISMELSATRHTLLAGKESGHIPTRHGSLPYRPGFRVFRFILHRVLTRGTPIGRKLAPKLFVHGDPLVRSGRRTSPPPASNGSPGSPESRTVFRCSRTAGFLTWRTSSGARGSDPTSDGSTCRSWETMASPSTTAAWSGPNRACTSSDSRSSTHSRPTSSPACPGITPSSRTTSPPGLRRSPAHRLSSTR